MDEVPNDGFNLTPDIWVGRTPVETGGEAEEVCKQGFALRNAWASSQALFDPAIYVADYWLHQNEFEQTRWAPPPDKIESAPETFFSHKDGTEITRIKISEDADPIVLQACHAPWKTSAQLPAGRALFAHQRDSSSPTTTKPVPEQCSGFSLRASSRNARNEMPTRFIQVEGPESDIVPEKFFWDPIGFESATDEKEKFVRRY